jgi:hypothetical protein
MFPNADVKSYLETSSTVSTESKVILELNMSLYDNIENYGCYRYEPTKPLSPYFQIADTYSSFSKVFYQNNTILQEINSSSKETEPIGLTNNDKKVGLYYTLDQCFKQFRPRSGINKAIYLNSNQYLDNFRSVNRPRFYMASKNDKFKYWTSFKKESATNTFTGISSNIQSNNNRGYLIDNAAPFVTYAEAVPTNRIVVKMQTGIGSQDTTVVNTFSSDGSSRITDPLTDRTNSQIPLRWKIQYLYDNGFSKRWIDAASFDENSVKKDGSKIVGYDGYVELYYGILPPVGFEDSFNFLDFVSIDPVEDGNSVGSSYLNKLSNQLFTWNGQEWVESTPKYGFSLLENDESSKVYVNKIVNPEYVVSDNGSDTSYLEFIYIDGLRVTVESMENPGKPFDLIEMTPRLDVDLTESVKSYSVSKKISDQNSGLPVGTITADNGSISLFNGDMAFSSFNAFNKEARRGSIVSKYLRPNARFLIFENISIPGKEAIKVPIKSFYAESFPSENTPDTDLTINLRDLMFRLENEKGPDLLLSSTTMTYAIAVLLDSIGFTNYSFVGFNEDNDFKIPFFFMSADLNVAQILEKIAVASQSCMFFDEYNNLIIMSKDYLSPENRDVDTVLLSTDSGNNKANITSIASAESVVFNDGVIKYNERYIQRYARNLAQASNIDFAKQYVYKPVLLWQSAGTEGMKSINGEGKAQQGYSMSAMALQANLLSNVPKVVNGQIVNNIIDVGENIYYIARYNGFFYVGTEVIKYDAVEFTITYVKEGVGTVTENVMIRSNEEYQRYFAKLAFNARMFPTGAIQIFAEPFYDKNGAIINGDVKSHGRGYFNTTVQSHFAGLRSRWQDTANSGSIKMHSEYLYSQYAYPLAYLTSEENKELFDSGLATDVVNLNVAGIATKPSEQPKIFGATSNMFAQKYFSELGNMDSLERLNKVQTSSLIITGPRWGENPRDFISYAKIKNSDAIPNTISNIFGTRMRVFGEIQGTGQNYQVNSGGLDYYQNINIVSNTGGTISDRPLVISGSGGGLGVFVDTDTTGGTDGRQTGYFFEITALSSSDLSKFTDDGEPLPRETLDQRDNNKIDYRDYYSYRATHNVAFYKLVPGTVSERAKIFTAKSEVAAGVSTLTFWLFGTQISAGQTINLTDLIDATPTGDTSPVNFSFWNGTHTIATAIYDNDGGSVGYQKYKYTITKTGSSAFTTTKFNLVYSNSVFNGYVYNNVSSRTAISVSYQPNLEVTVNKEDHGLLPDDIIRLRGVENKASLFGKVTAVTGTLIVVDVQEVYGAIVGDVAPGAGAVFNNWTISRFGTRSPKVLYASQSVQNVPVKLYGGKANILVDNGTMIGSSRALNQENPTVYDLAVEFSGDINSPRFDLYINNKLVGSVLDPEPMSRLHPKLVTEGVNYLKKTNSVMFTRGTSSCIFENFYQISKNETETNIPVESEFSRIIGGYNTSGTPLDVKNYTITPFLQETMRGISTQTFPKYSVYFEEFGAIARECSYFNIRFDQAFPALKSKIFPIKNGQKVYTTSNYYANAYGAEFLIFNITDGPVVLDETTSNWLRILGITFTNTSTKELDIDDYINQNNAIKTKYYQNILNSREKHGVKSFSIDSEYIQNYDMASSILDWVINKTVNPKLHVSLQVFAMPNLSLGDVVTLDIKFKETRESYSEERAEVVQVDPSKKFIVFGIEYRRDADGPNMVVNLVEA